MGVLLAGIAGPAAVLAQESTEAATMQESTEALVQESTEAALAEESTEADTRQQNTVLSAGERRIEQIYANLPEVTVYAAGYGKADLDGAEAYLAQERLAFEGMERFADTEEGICYYILLDISGSIPNAYFRSIKDGIQALQEQLREQDRLVLCAFGEDVVLEADGSQTAEELAAILAELKNYDQKTLLFEGIDRVAALAQQEQGGVHRRNVLAVISDGEDIAVGKAQAQEAQNTLMKTGIPAYAFCIRDTATENINTFGEFARTSGGSLVTFQAAEGSEILCDLADRLGEDIQVRYTADTNLVTNQEEQFTLKLADGTVQTRSLMNTRWIPDEEAPVMVEAVPAGERQLRLTFSEPMSGLETAANYHLSLEDRTVEITGVSCGTENEQTVTLSLAEPVRNGTYQLSCANITDLSMEKHPLSGEQTILVEGIQASEPGIQTPPPQPGGRAPGERAFDYTGVLFLIFIAVVALIVVLLVLNSKKKKTEEAGGKADGGEPRKQDGQGLSGNGAVSDQDHRPHWELEGSGGPAKLPLQVQVSRNGGYPEPVVWEIGTSLIIGRSSICDVSVNDSEMSRQHFCLERDGSGIFISDLHSLNGTAVNGIGIREKRRLEPGAVISAGTMTFTIRW